MIHGKKISYTCDSSIFIPLWHWNATTILNPVKNIGQGKVCSLTSSISRMYKTWSQNIHRCPTVVFTCLSEFWRAMCLLEKIPLIRHYAFHTLHHLLLVVLTHNITLAIYCFWLEPKSPSKVKTESMGKFQIKAANRMILTKNQQKDLWARTCTLTASDKCVLGVQKELPFLSIRSIL